MERRMMETFDFIPLAMPTVSTKQRSVVAQFGDGYAQRSGDGINGNSEEWSLDFQGCVEDINEIRDFLNRHGGWKSFIWVTPMGETQHFVTPEGYSYSPHVGIDLVSLSVKLVQNNRLV